jgi:signal peptidase I
MKDTDPVPPTLSTTPPRQLLRILAGWVRDVSLSLLIAAVVILFIYQPVQVEGTSMMPTLVDRERIFINKFTYRLGLEKIERGDMVVFWAPEDPRKSYIKRVIGLPGDVVRIDRGLVYVNGSPLREDYVPEAYRDHQSYPPVRVLPGHYYVLGDHRTSSNDSRVWGPVPRENIYGKAVFVYWPPEKIGPVR